MKGTDIADALSVNPLAEFAFRPKFDDVKIVRVRGLLPTGIPGTWRYTESTDLESADWRKPASSINVPTARSGSLCTVEDAKRQVKARIEANAQHFADNAKLDRLVDTLTKHGVAARRFAGGVHVLDAVALGRLLARLP